MKKVSSRIVPDEKPLTNVEFMETYNKNIPESFPRASLALLEKFKAAHNSLFKKKDIWTLDQHRKRLIDWLPQNLKF